ncbi:MAG: PGPGW domain-containing protein [Acidobacteria bacterium]|nr:PGPGW domain-containing protein [Acidobacteriota bacterium]
MNRAVKKALALVAGWVFIILGVIGLFLPFMQGVLFIIIGLTILSSEYVWAHHLLTKVRTRFPRIAGFSDRAQKTATGWVRRVYQPEETH